MVKGKLTNLSKSRTSFRQFAKVLSDSIGQHQIPIIEDSDHPGSFISSEAIHYELVKRIFRSIYKANHCYHLNAPVTFLPTFDVLGKIHVELTNSGTSDIDQVNLLHDIGEIAADYFKNYESFPSRFDPSTLNYGRNSSKSKIARIG